MSNKYLETNVGQAYNQFADLTLQQMKRAVKGALAEGSKLLVKETKGELQSEVPNAVRPNPKYTDTLIDAVRWRIEKNGTTAKVHIMGSRASGSGTFRARFFERGTKTGNIKAKHYFNTAINKVNPQIGSTFEQVLAKHIEKINQSKK